MSEKLYAGHGKALETQYGRRLKLGFRKEELELMLENLNERGYCNILVSPKKDDAGVFYGTIDTFEPQQSDDGSDPQPF